jgi:hydroxymethylglutaryl-CoA reductase
MEQEERLLNIATECDCELQRLGGGARSLEIFQYTHPATGPFLSLHVTYDVRDAMGANAVNSAMERLAPVVEEISGGRVLLRILSNLADKRLARARVKIPVASLAFNGYSGEVVRDNVIAAWAYAAVDPHRAATHNKGIMNGIDAVTLATGNDWRAVEAGAHAYAARNGRYTSLSTWEKDQDGNLFGSLEMPMAVGIVGGATKAHPAAQAATRLLGVRSASELAGVIVSVGLAQNLAALRALATEGIQRGHMDLHARQIALSAGADPVVVNQLAERLISEKAIRIDRAKEILKEWTQSKE